MAGRRSARLRDEAPAAAPAPGGERRAAHAAAAAAAAERRARAAARALEVEDSPRVLRDKCRRLARALRNAKHLVVYTGAGISTAADIPDYRGPRGVWTRLRRGETVGRVEVALARPTFTHMALRALWARGTLKFVVSQNCDGLHLRSGLPRRALAELHGDAFAEGCAHCRRVYLRAFDTTERTARHRHATRRLCHACGRELRDSIVHFGERGRAAWPLNWAGALRHAARADVVLCLGSSLKVLRRYPRLWRMHSAPAARPRLYIVNLQWTPKDAVAALKINARCDTVMRQVARRLRLRVPRYSSRVDPLLAHAEPLTPPEVHTTRRPPLRVSPAASFASASSSSGGASPSSPSPSDSDEELPLRRLADRLRAPRALRAFRVALHSGEATILLRAEHAPPEPEPPRNPTAELRRFRFVRPPPAPPAGALVNGAKEAKESKEAKPPKWERPPSPSESASAAAAIIARAVLVCRASLYSGLHTIIAPAEEAATAPAASAAPAECAWCARRCASARCLWYGAPRATPPEARVWRVVRGRRFLCACCGPDDEPPPLPPPPPQAQEAGDGGWFGKGYRKGRRRRR
ncbi:hypothetical protein K1T71_006906 [Dendrolimus kikuchii]|uniref:Uncharacterized protein n=1 Tax=Dendrolimus kikuchii TaxID=765133 RepID=A0ACC1CZ74_9NEOP|nr:hypothetical protein K1T71_006906 [Dendrolimus kikuchii]